MVDHKRCQRSQMYIIISARNGLKECAAARSGQRPLVFVSSGLFWLFPISRLFSLLFSNSDELELAVSFWALNLIFFKKGIKALQRGVESWSFTVNTYLCELFSNKLFYFKPKSTSLHFLLSFVGSFFSYCSLSSCHNGRETTAEMQDFSFMLAL